MGEKFKPDEYAIRLTAYVEDDNRDKDVKKIWEIESSELEVPPSSRSGVIS